MKKAVREVPFSEGVVMVIYEDGSKGLKSIREAVIPETAVDDSPATESEVAAAIQESNPMMRKYVESLRAAGKSNMPKKKGY